MGLLKAWFGPDKVGELGTHGQVHLRSRVINVSDLLEVERELKKAFPRVEVGRSAIDYSSPGRPLVEPLDKASDEVLRGIKIEAWAAGQWPAFALSVGQDRPSDATTTLIHDRVEGLSEEQIGSMAAAASRSVEIVAGAGRRVLNRRQWLDLARLAVVLIYLAVLASFAVSVWPHVLWAVVAALAVIPTAVLAAQRLGRWVGRYFPDYRPERIIVRHITRDEWRRQRYERRRDWKAVGVGFVVGLLASLATALLLGAFGLDG